MTLVDSVTSPSALTSRTAPAGPRGALGQDSFLQLLTTQLRNQDPLNPLQNSEFIGQMAQFSTVSGINQMNETLKSMANGAGTPQGMATVAALIGRQVLVASPQARPDAAGTVAGRFTLDTAASSVVVTYADTDTGAILHNQILGPTAPGEVEFAWADPVGTARRVSVSVSAATARGVEAPMASTFARVVGGMPGTTGTEALLEVEGFGLISALEIQSIR
jgi:flagellar basal-body rod modification protein FlgD